MKLDINVGILDAEVLNWYDNASENEVTNAIYHGYRVVSNPEYSKKLDEMPSSNDNLVNQIEILEKQVEMYKIQLREPGLYNKQMDSIVLETKSRYESQYSGRLKSKDDRICEIQKTIPQLLGDKKRLINEKVERIEEQIKMQKTLEGELLISKERCFKLESIMNNSSKKLTMLRIN